MLRLCARPRREAFPSCGAPENLFAETASERTNLPCYVPCAVLSAHVVCGDAADDYALRRFVSSRAQLAGIP
jgi:hypothetical protein